MKVTVGRWAGFLRLRRGENEGDVDYVTITVPFGPPPMIESEMEACEALGKAVHAGWSKFEKTKKFVAEPESEETFACPICGRKFWLLKVRDAHLKRDHALEVRGTRRRGLVSPLLPVTLAVILVAALRKLTMRHK